MSAVPNLQLVVFPISNLRLEVELGMYVFVISKLGPYGYDTIPKAMSKKVRSSEQEVVSSMIGIGGLLTLATRQMHF